MSAPRTAPSGDPMWRRVFLAIGIVVATLVGTGIAFSVLEAVGASEGLQRAGAVAFGGALLIALALMLVAGLPGHTRRVLLGGRIRPERIAAGIGLGIVALIGSASIVAGGAAVDDTAKRRLEELDDFPDLGVAALVLIAIGLVIFAPVGEEILFRGTILRSLALRLDFWPAAVVSSLIFAASHPDAWIIWPRAVSLVFAGLVLALAYRLLGLAGSIAAHATVNLVAMIAIATTAG